MPAPPLRSTLETRHDQMFPILDPAEIDRVRRFGEPHSFAPGEYIVRTGQVSPGMLLILAGEVVIAQRDEHAEHPPIVVHGPGSIMAELAQLSEQPSLVDGVARGPVQAVVIPARRVRDLMVQEAELGERIMRALILRRVGLLETSAGGPIIVGRASDGNVLRLEGFLSRNGHPHKRLDPDNDSCARTLIERFHVGEEELPLVLCPNGESLRNPSEGELARCMGLVRPIDDAKIYDVIIVGAGPAGLAAAVYCASEGLSVIVLDCRAFGGQAGASARIENYLGFPTGITGLALMARAYNQGLKFGVEMAIPNEVVCVEEARERGGRFKVGLKSGEKVRGRAIIVASGARYRRLECEKLPAFEGNSVHYWASPLEAKLCSGQEVALVGAGNSAGQAAVYLASQVAKVWLLVRGPSLTATMSSYLIQRIEAQPNIEVLVDTEVCDLEGDHGILEKVTWCNRRTMRQDSRPIRHLFLLIGAEPNTDWLKEYRVQLDNKGFILAGAEAGAHYAMETSRPGIFAIGDIRSGSVKRIAAAVGEGAQVCAVLHTYLADDAAAQPAVAGEAHA